MNSVVRFLSLLLIGVLSGAQVAAVEVLPLAPDTPVSHARETDAIPDEALLTVRFLKAQAAYEQGDLRQARRLINEITPWIPEGHVLHSRLRALRDRVDRAQRLRVAPVERVESRGTVIEVESEGVGQVPWAWFSADRPYLALLPLSGRYGAAGRAMLATMRAASAFRPLEVIDSALFDASELKQLIDAYGPAWLLGPLRPETAAALAQAGVSQPMLVLASRCPESVVRCVPLVPSLQAAFLRQGRLQLQRRRSLLLVDTSRWMALPLSQREPIIAAAAETVLLDEKSADAVLRDRLNLSASQARIGWLAHQLGHGLVSRPRPRGDYEQVVMFTSAQQAYQVASLLRYWGVDTPLYWFPSRPPSFRLLDRQLSTWPAMTAWLHPFLVSKSPQYSNFGIFHATAQSVVRVLGARPDTEAVLPIGWLESDERGWLIRLRPVRIEPGRIELPR